MHLPELSWYIPKNTDRAVSRLIMQKGSVAILHHACQTEYEYSKYIDCGPPKRCFHCMERNNGKKSSSSIATNIAL